MWLDGQITDGRTALVSALDHGFTVGDGVFESLFVRDGTAFATRRHLDRLERSAQVLGLPLPSRRTVQDAMAQVLAAAGPLPLARLRITVTAGVGPMGSLRPAQVNPTLVVAVAPITAWPDHIEAVTVPWPRNERSAVAGAKTTSYAENVVALAEATRRGANEALLPNTRGHLCEGTNSNVLLLLHGRLLTPPLSSGCLAGVTRELLLEWADDEGLPIAEEDIPMEALGEADDVMITSSTRGVQHVDVVDGRSLQPSELGAAASRMFMRRASQTADP